MDEAAKDPVQVAVQDVAKDAAIKVVDAKIAIVQGMPSSAPWWAQWMVYNASQFYKWWSTWVMALIAAAPMLIEFVPQLHDVVSPSVEHFIVTGLGLLAFIARLKAQPPKP